MAWTPAKDISRWQGNWQDTGEPIVLIKMSGGDDGLYMDDRASANYSAAVNAGKAVGGYHFGGGQVAAEAEAAYFLQAMSPIAENDVFALDVEADLANRPDVVQWCDDFIVYLCAHGISGGLLYMNLATLNAHDWSTPLGKWGLWLADWAVDPEATIPTHYTYVMQQYADGPNYDHDAWFGSVDQFKAYGYHSQAATQPAVPDPTPVEAPQEPAPQPATQDVVTPTTVAAEPTEVVVVGPAPAPTEINTNTPAPAISAQEPPLLGEFCEPEYETIWTRIRDWLVRKLGIK